MDLALLAVACHRLSISPRAHAAAQVWDRQVHKSSYILFRRGSAKYTNGGRYEGDFKCEHRWGWGRHIYPGGDHYEGQWIDDKIQGVCGSPCTVR